MHIEKEGASVGKFTPPWHWDGKFSWFSLTKLNFQLAYCIVTLLVVVVVDSVVIFMDF